MESKNDYFTEALKDFETVHAFYMKKQQNMDGRDSLQKIVQPLPPGQEPISYSQSVSNAVKNLKDESLFLLYKDLGMIYFKLGRYDAAFSYLDSAYWGDPEVEFLKGATLYLLHTNGRISKDSSLAKVDSGNQTDAFAMIEQAFQKRVPLHITQNAPGFEELNQVKRYRHLKKIYGYDRIEKWYRKKRTS
jgi:tetratricopeptide (TPR) repeat protein